MRDWFYMHKEYGLCLTWKILTDCGVSYKTIESASGRNAWGMVPHPEHKKKKLIPWKHLKTEYKEKVEKLVGDPYEYMAKQPIRELFVLDHKAEDFYRKKLLAMNVTNLSEVVTNYTNAATVLNFLHLAKQNKRFIREKLNLTLNQLLSQLCEIIHTDKIKLPETPRELEKKYVSYREQGYECLISKKFGNKAAAKIGKSEGGYDEQLAEKQIALVRRAASMHNNFDSQQIAFAVNQVFEAKGWPTVSGATVYNIIKVNKHLTTAGARGKRAYHNEIAMQVKRTRPNFPLQYFTLDGWTVELAYAREDGSFSRLVVVIVLDTMNNYPIGFAIGDRETAALIREANINAGLHIQELFGAPYRPWQIQSDNFGIKQNTPFFEAMAKLYTPAAVGNAKSKVIEPYFMYLNKKYCQPQYNWMGFNIDASKKNQVNREYSDKIKKTFPTKEGVIQQIEAIIYTERKLKYTEYIQQWGLMAEDEKLTYNRIDWLMVFGKTTGFTNSLTGMGLQPTIEGQKIVFDSFDPQFRSLQHLNWKVVYDEQDLSSVLAISEDDKHRFVLEQKRAIPMNIHSMTKEDHAYLAKINQYKKDRVKEVLATYEKDACITNEVVSDLSLTNDEEFGLKTMFIHKGQQKDKIQDAKRLQAVKQIAYKQAKKDAKQIEQERKQKAQNWQQLQRQYLESKTDFNQYLDQ